MGNPADQLSANNPNKRNSSLALASLLLGILGFVLPCLAFFIWGFALSDYFIDRIGLQEFNRLNVYIPMVLWITGPIAIIVGFLSVQKHKLENIPESQNKNAKIGIALGVLTIPCVLLPLILWLLLAEACAHGC